MPAVRARRDGAVLRAVPALPPRCREVGVRGVQAVPAWRAELGVRGVHAEGGEEDEEEVNYKGFASSF